jgi:hypothetical protein
MRNIIRYGIALSLTFIAACRDEAPSASEAKIFGGAETSDYAAVTRVLVDQSRGRFCTGIAVSESTLLLAGHCIKNETIVGDIHPDLSANLKPGISAADMRKAKKFVAMWHAVGGLELLTDEAAAKDLAVVWFDNAPFQRHVKIARSALDGKVAKPHESVTLVGFGAKDYGASIGTLNSAGIKRVGSNEIAAARDGIYLVKAQLASNAPDGNAAQAAGDAGGPLFDSKGELIAIGAGVRLLNANGRATGTIEGPWQFLLPNPDEAAVVENAFVSLASDAARNLLRYAVKKGATIEGIAGDVPQSFKPEDDTWATPNAVEKRGGWVAMCGGGVIDPSVEPKAANAAGLLGSSSELQLTSSGASVTSPNDPFYSSSYPAMFGVAAPGVNSFNFAPSPMAPFMPQDMIDQWNAMAQQMGMPPFGVFPGMPGAPGLGQVPGPGQFPGLGQIPQGPGIGSVIPMGPFPGGGGTCVATGPNAVAISINGVCQ